MEIHQESASVSNQGTSWTFSFWWQAPGWVHSDTLGQSQTVGMGCHCPWHLYYSHINSTCTSITAGAAANHAATAKSAKYANLTSTHIFVPFIVETSGAWNAQAIELIQEIGRRTTAVTGDPLETNHLFQRLSIAIQQANALYFTSTFKSEWEPYPTVIV